MLPSLLTLLFVSGALAASALAHDERRWRYGFLLAVGCAAWLTIWSARNLQQLVLRIDIELYAPLSVVAAALPFCAVLRSLLARPFQSTCAPIFNPEQRIHFVWFVYFVVFSIGIVSAELLSGPSSRDGLLRRSQFADER